MTLISAIQATDAAELREERRVLFGLVVDGEHPIELRFLVPEDKRGGPDDDGWRKWWADTPERADEQAALLTARGYDVFVGMLPRLGRSGEDQRRYAPTRLLWADCDSDRSVHKLALFEPTPTLVVRSGGMDGATPKRHGYWLLADPLPAEQVHRHALRLAHHFESDPQVADAGRVMRVPGSRSHKTGRIARLERFTGETHPVEAVTGGLEDSPRYEPPDNERPVMKSTDELVVLFAGHYHDGDGHHEHFRSVCGVLIRRCSRMPPDVLLEVACSWAKEHTHPCRPRRELERNFDNVLDRELKRRGLA